MVESGRTPLLTPAELHDLGFDLIVSPLSGLLAATAALAEAYGRLAEHGTLRDDLDRLATFDEFTDIVGLPTPKPSTSAIELIPAGNYPYLCRRVSWGTETAQVRSWRRRRRARAGQRA